MLIRTSVVAAGADQGEDDSVRSEIVACLPERRFAAKTCTEARTDAPASAQSGPSRVRLRHRQAGRERPPWQGRKPRDAVLRGVAHAPIAL